VIMAEFYLDEFLMNLLKNKQNLVLKKI